MRYKFQIIYPSDSKNENIIIDWFFYDAEVMQKMGINVGTKPMQDATVLMYRGFVIIEEEKYPKDPRFLNNYKQIPNKEEIRFEVIGKYGNGKIDYSSFNW